MTKLSKLWWVGPVALLAACSPYDDTNTGDPQVLSVSASLVNIQDDFGVLGSADGVANTDGTWSVPDVPRSLDDGTAIDALVFFATFNKTMDGASIQATTTSCAPAAGVNLTVNGATAGDDWWTCYSPGSGTPTAGSSVVIYQGLNVTPGAGGGGWTTAALIQDAGYYTIALTVKDKQGREVPLAFTAGIATALEGTATGIDTADLTWGSVLGAVSFELQRASDIVTSAGTALEAHEPDTANYTTVAAGIDPATLSFSDTGITYDAANPFVWYRVIARNADGLTAASAGAIVDFSDLP